VEIKSKTWSLIDAEQKTKLASALLEFLGLTGAKAINDDYHKLV
jgi:mannose-6-phosphate isomerase class I